MCSTISPLPLRHCFGMFQRNRVWKAQPVSFTRALNCQEWANQFRDPRVKSVLNYLPPPSAPPFWFVPKEPCMESPTSIFHQSLELPRMGQPVSRSKGQKSARLSAPSLCATVLVCFKGTVYGKPNVYLSPEPWRVGTVISGMWWRGGTVG